MQISRENRPKFIAVAIGLLLTIAFWFWSNIHPDTLLGEIRDRLDGVVYDTRLTNTLNENLKPNELSPLSTWMKSPWLNKAVGRGHELNLRRFCKV
jgi:hypothetical protein